MSIRMYVLSGAALTGALVWGAGSIIEGSVERSHASAVEVSIADAPLTTGSSAEGSFDASVDAVDARKYGTGLSVSGESVHLDSFGTVIIFR